MRQAAVLFLVVGVVGLVNDVVPGSVGYGHPLSAALDSMCITVGLGAWVLAGRSGLAGAVSVLLPLIAFTYVALNNVLGVLPPIVYGMSFVLIFVWVGAWHVPGTSVALSPFAAAAYLVPLFAGVPHPDGAAQLALLVVPVAVITGEVLSYNVTALQREHDSREKLLGELAHANLTDPLTGVGNRRLGDLLLQSVSRDDAVVLLVLDDFKRVNDSFGHPEGDRVLRLLGEYLRHSIRPIDGVARMGGEEFMVVLRGAGHEALATADRLLAGWRSLGPRTTLSAGVAPCGWRLAASAAYDHADTALYRAKRSGRDRAVLFGGHAAPLSKELSIAA